MDWKSIKDTTGKSFVSADEYEQYIKDNIITPLMSVPDEYQNEVGQKFAQLLEFEAGDMDIVDFVTELQKYLNGLGITIDLTPLLGNTEEIKKNYSEVLESAVAKFTSKNRSSENINAERKALDDFAKQNSIDTQNEIAFWNQCLEESNTREEAMRKYLDSTVTSPEDGTSTQSISQTIDQLNTQLKPAFNSLKDAYLDIFTLDDNGKEIFSLENVDLSMLDDIKSTIDELNENEELGINIDYSSFEDLSKTLMDSESTADEVRKSINLFATDIINALNPAINQTTGENYKFVQSLLESLNIVNSEAVMISSLGYSYEEYVLAKEECAEAGFDLANATQDEIDAFMYEEDGSIKCGQALALLELKKQLVNGTLLDTNSDIENVLTLAKAAGITIESLDKLATAKSKFDEAVKTGDGRLIGSAAIELQHAKDEVENAILDFEPVNVDFAPKHTGKKSSSSDKDTSKEFDWIERAIDNIEKQISRLNKISDSAYSSASEKNKALADQIHLVNQEIALQQKAYEGYMEKANSVGLSDDYKNLVQAGAINIEKITDKELQEKISSYQEYYDKAQETQDKINDLYEQSNDYHVSAYELHLEKLDRLRDNQSISEREYLNRKQQLYIKYYNDNVKLAEVAHEAKLELLNEEKEYLQSVANSAIDILGEQIDDLKEKQDEEVKAIEAKKKPLEDQLELLEEAKEKEDRILMLQKAQYELKRAQSQRDKLTYVDGQMVYRNDDKAVRDAQKAVDDAEYDMVVGNIQDQIDAYDRQIDKVNERYETEIAQIQKVQNEWEKVIALEERSINRVNFESMFGSDGIPKLLSGDMSQIEQWKNKFAGVLKDIDLTNDGVIGAVAKEFSDLANVDLSKTTSQTQAVIDQYEVLKASVGDTTSAIGATSSEQTEDKSKAENVEGKEESSSTLIGAMEESYVVAEETLPAEAEMFDNITSSVQSATNAVYEYKSAIESLGSASSGVPVTPHAEGTVGKAFANGTGDYKGLAHAEKNALRSEYGQPELTVYPDGTTELTTEPTMSDLPRNTVIFNEEQTKRIMNNEGTIIGNAHADGNAVLQKAELPSYLRPIQEGDKGYELIKAARVYQDMLKTNIMLPVSSIDKNVDMMARNISAVNTSNVNKPTVNVGGITVNCPNVNSKEIAMKVSTELEKAVFGMSNYAYQKASITR